MDMTVAVMPGLSMIVGGVSPTLNTMEGGNRQPLIIEKVRVKQVTKQTREPTIYRIEKDMSNEYLPENNR